MRAWIPLLVALVAGACRSATDIGEVFAPGVTPSFEGQVSLSETELFAIIEADVEGLDNPISTPAQADDAAYALEEAYRRRGHPFPRVSYDFEPLPAAGARIVFRIEEGARTRVSSLTFLGNQAFGPDELAGFFRPRGGLFEDTTFFFVESDLASGLTSLRRFYAQKGYQRAEARLRPPRFSDDRREAFIEVEVTEGPLFKIGSVEVEGWAPGAEERRQALIDRYTGSVFTRFLVYEIRARWIELHKERGYPDCTADVQVQMDEHSGEVSLSYHISPGPLVSIGKVEIQGVVDTRQSVVRSRLELGEGDRFDSSKLQESFGALFATGLFSAVRVELAEGEGEVRDLRVEVTEAPTLEFFVEPGYGSYEGPRLKVGIQEGDFLRKAIRLRSEITVSPRAQSGNISLTDPRAFDSRFGAGITVFAERREEPSFTREDYGTRLSVTRQWSPKFESSLQYELRRSDVEDVDVSVTPDQLLVFEQQIDISSLSLTLTRDTRNHPIVSKTGGLTRGTLEWGSQVLGSDLDFLGLQSVVSRFWPLGSATVLAFGSRIGAIFPVGDTDTIPLQERFFNGGEDSVRSFREDELGPKDGDGDPLGGEAFNLYSLELRHRFAGNFSGALFFDAGNVASQAEDVLDFEDFRFAAGVGLRYLLPIGPLRIDLGLNPSARSGEDDFVLHFAVGLPF